MRRFIAAVWIGLGWVGACAIEDSGTLSDENQISEGGASSTGGYGGGANVGNAGATTACFPSPDQKLCGDACPSKDDARYGCGSSSCQPCELPNVATHHCNDQFECEIGECEEGFADCNGEARDGCETNTRFDPRNCSECGRDCTRGGTSQQVCRSGVCEVSECARPMEDCNGEGSDDCEVNLDTDDDHCGFCYNACSLLHAESHCEAGECVITSCEYGWDNCDGEDWNGCEQDIHSDWEHCGGCDANHRCSDFNGAPGCVLGNCTISCQFPYMNCDNDVSDGCEENRQTDIDHCGGCGLACSRVHGEARCEAMDAEPYGVCAITCADPYDDCDNDVATGCEADTHSELQHCGSCNNSCTLDYANERCSSGNCEIESCVAGHSNCNGYHSDGCECAHSCCGSACRDLQNDPDNCGTCGHDCDTDIENANTGCSNGACTIASCPVGRTNCDGTTSNGCECTQDCCGNGCVDLDTNKANCGTCGNDCGSIQHANTDCSAGNCVILSCQDGRTDCNGMVSDGCECEQDCCGNRCIDLDTDDAHCGTCGNDCSTKFDHGVGHCVNGTCEFVECEAEYRDCNGNLSCECPVGQVCCGPNCCEPGEICNEVSGGCELPSGGSGGTNAGSTNTGGA